MFWYTGSMFYSGIPRPTLFNLRPAQVTHGEEVDDQDLDKAAREFAGKF